MYKTDGFNMNEFYTKTRKQLGCPLKDCLSLASHGLASLMINRKCTWKVGAILKIGHWLQCLKEMVAIHVITCLLTALFSLQIVCTYGTVVFFYSLH